MNDYKLYMHINKINGKRYIGITQQRIERRWRKNGEGYKRSIFFYKAIQKYGWENFEHIILEEGLTLEEANQKEKELIKQYDTTNEKYGYNLDLGGTNGKHNERTIQVLRDNMNKRLESGWRPSHLFKKGEKPTPMTEEGRRSLSNYMKENNPMFNKETLEKMRQSKIGRFCREDNPSAKKVLCVETGEIFNCIKSANDKYGKSIHISDVCRGNRETAGGYHWEYVKEVE